MKSDQGNLIERSQERLAIVFLLGSLEWKIAKNQGKMRAIYPLSSFPCVKESRGWLHCNRRSDSAPLNSAPISTRPATDFHVGISTPEFRPDDATLKYDVTLRQLSLSSCPNPSRAISCLDHRSSALLKFVSLRIAGGGSIAQVVAVV